MTHDPRYPERIDAKPLREAVEEFLQNTGCSWSDLCFRLEWTRYDKRRKLTQGDTNRLKRCLGIDYNYSSHTFAKTIQQSTAVKIIDIIGRVPSEFGI